ncbi:MAG TPA: DMT family transporter [Allosphingosinicella sp.]|jgi:transporter family-2 protein
MPTNLILPALLVLFAGAMTAAQPPTNAILARSGGSVIFAALLSFAVGTLALLAVLAAIQPRVSLGALPDVPWYAWAGGFYGAFFVAVGAYAAPRLGIASLITVAVAGQMVAAVIIDHYGAFGIDRAPISPGRLLGILLVLGGVVLVRRF